MVNDGILFGLGLGLWIGYFVPRWKDIIDLFKQSPNIMKVPPTIFIFVYGVGLLALTVAIAAIYHIWWSVFFFTNGTIIPVSLTQIDSNLFGDNKS